MQFEIDNLSSRPVYQQIVDQVKHDVAIGRLKQGDRLPTVRKLAALLTINPNTIAKAYKMLEQQHIITTRPGAGAFVADIDSALTKAVKKKIITVELERTIVDSFHMQIDAKTLSEWFERAVAKFNLDASKGAEK
jgi:GntR family transcriptional regulator